MSLLQIFEDKRLWEMFPAFYLYKDTYWGNFDIQHNPDIVVPQIIANRIKLTRVVDLPESPISYVEGGKRPQYVKNIIDKLPDEWKDHIEVYKMRYVGYMIFSSPYGKKHIKSEYDFFIEKPEALEDWELTKPIYSRDAITIGYFQPLKKKTAHPECNANGIDIFNNKTGHKNEIGISTTELPEEWRMKDFEDFMSPLSQH